MPPRRIRMNFLRMGRPAAAIAMAVITAGASLCLLAGALWAGPAAGARPETWAQPVEMTGVTNLYRVSGTLYRCHQPDAVGMQNLKKMGIKTIINLRSFHSDRQKMAGEGFDYVHIHMKAWHPEEEDVVQFLRVVLNPARTPVLVHCQHGADRTGVMVAVYRIAVQGWSKDEAIREMTEGGFGFHGIWSNLPNWVRKLDIDAIRRQAGINRTEKSD